jgi:prevent-host-death family protein
MSGTESSEPEVMSASEVRQHFGEVVNRVARGEGRVIVEKNGAPAVGVVSMEDVRRLRNQDDEIVARKSLLTDFQALFEGIPDDELERETERALEEVRAERRAARRRPVGSTS